MMAGCMTEQATTIIDALGQTLEIFVIAGCVMVYREVA